MRSYPSARTTSPTGLRHPLRVRLGVTVLAGFTALGLVGIPAYADHHAAGHHAAHQDTAGHPSAGHHAGPPSLQHRRDAVGGRIHHAAADLDESSVALVRATHDVERARAGLTRARTRAAAVHDRLAAARVGAQRARAALITARQQLAEADASLREGQQAVVSQRQSLRNQILTDYAQGDPSLRAIGALFGAGSLDDLGNTLHSESIVNIRGTQVHDELITARASLASQRSAVATSTQEVAARESAAHQQVTVVHGFYLQARTATIALRSSVQDTVAARHHVVAVRRHDRQVLAHLRTREHAIRQRILALAAREHGGVTGAGRGFLLNPAAGYPITSPYGYRVNPVSGVYDLHDGDDFGVPCGTALRAAGTGTVISEYADPVWGNRLFLSLGRVDGHNLTVIYNHLTSWVAGRGAHVTRGAIVAHSGTTGWSTGCHLHFTVMVDGVAVDPQRWL